ncbi:Transcriptional regulator, GntR family [Paraburkholderia sabiae]|nr:Transcriptional regulator, GntR family [Paraburkholderia sabiae]
MLCLHSPQRYSYPHSHGHNKYIMDYRHLQKRKSLHARIVQELGIEIVSGRLMPGERLPAEATLCEKYGVSRPVLREATRVLVAKGLVVSKPRVGSVVRPREEWHMLDPDVLYWTLNSIPEGEFFLSLMTVRRIIEPAAAALAATAATDEDLARIGSAYDRMEHAQSAGDLLEPDLEFHRAIMAATHNDMLAYIGNMMSLALSESIKLTSRHPDTHALSLPRHKAILTAILNRDALAARQASLVQLEHARADADTILGIGSHSLT